MLITMMKLIRATVAALWRPLQWRLTAADLHSLSDSSLRDIGVARSEIDEQVRTSSRRHAQSRNSSALI